MCLTDARADAHDMFFDGLVATVAACSTTSTVMHVAVTIDDDPATEALLSTAATCSSIPTRSSHLPPRAATRRHRREPHAYASSDPRRRQQQRQRCCRSIGNIFLGDDGFGVRSRNDCAAVLSPRACAPRLRDPRRALAYELLDGYGPRARRCRPMGEEPGTTALLEPRSRARSG